MKKLEMKEMEVIEGGGANCGGLAVTAFASAVGSIFFAPAAYLSWAAIGAWMSSCTAHN